MMRLGLALGVMLAATTAQAGDGRWHMVDSEGAGTGAYFCPIDDDTTGNFLCLRLECTNSTPLYFDLSYAGGPDAPANLPVEISVDGALAGQVDFGRSFVDGDYADLMASFEANQHMALVEALRHGDQATLKLNFPDRAMSLFMPLKGSSVTLGNVMAACPLAAPTPRDPAAKVLGEVKASCAEMGGSVSIDPGFKRWEDLDGDGVDDLVLDYASVVCSTAASLYCGTGGCNTGMYLVRGDHFSELFNGLFHDYRVLPDHEIAFALHGSACGLAGAEACTKIYRIVGDNLVFLEQMTGVDADAVMSTPIDPDPASAPASSGSRLGRG